MGSKKKYFIGVDPASPKGDKSYKIEGYTKDGITTITKVTYDVDCPDGSALYVREDSSE